MASVGMVYTTPEGDRAVFLTMADIAALQQSIAAFRQRPTVAGDPLAATTFDGLAARLDRADAADAHQQRSVALTAEDQRHLELLLKQAVIHQALPPRLRRTCAACGSERIVNPALPKPRKAGSDEAGSVLSSIQLLSEGHPILAGLTFLAGAAGNNSEGERPVCDRCEGVDFDHVAVTFCPGCRELRTETILLTCPTCAHDFTGAGESASTNIWTDMNSAAEARNVASLHELSSQFENGFYPDQLRLLEEALGAGDEPICMCRCALPTEFGRYVALLLTSEHVVWSRQSVISAVTGGKLAWRDVAEVNELPGAAHARGIEIVGNDGNVLKFNGFLGIGVNLEPHEVAFTPAGIREQAARLNAQGRSAAAGAATKAAVPPAPPPAPPWAPLVTPTPPTPLTPPSPVEAAEPAPARGLVETVPPMGGPDPEPPTNRLIGPPAPTPAPGPAVENPSGPPAVRPPAPPQPPTAPQAPVSPPQPAAALPHPQPSAAPPQPPSVTPQQQPPAAAPRPHPSLVPPQQPPAAAPQQPATTPTSPAPPQPAAAQPQPPTPTPQPTPAPQPAPAYAVPAQPMVPAGWYPDPWRVARLRWWDGTRWTWHIAP